MDVSGHIFIQIRWHRKQDGEGTFLRLVNVRLEIYFKVVVDPYIDMLGSQSGTRLFYFAHFQFAEKLG